MRWDQVETAFVQNARGGFPTRGENGVRTDPVPSAEPACCERGPTIMSNGLKRNSPRRLRQSAAKTLHTFVNVLPVIVGMLLLISLVLTVVPKGAAATLFGTNDLVDALAGAGLGSLAAGHPLTSYLLGGELLAGGIGLTAVTALIVSWVTVGLVQLPAEMMLLGRRFAIYRNGTCFLFAIVIAYLTVLTLKLLG